MRIQLFYFISSPRNKEAFLTKEVLKRLLYQIVIKSIFTLSSPCVSPHYILTFIK